jgi:hypothetical protein
VVPRSSVQGITINRKYRPLPTLAIASESRQNLKDLKLTMFNILSVVSGVPIEQIHNKIDFVMTDSTSHNLGVGLLVTEELGVQHTPSHLLCQVHPALMMVRKLEEVCKEIESTIGSDKLHSSFTISLTNNNDSISCQFIDAMHRFISHDFNHKAWNRADAFGQFIHPKKNISVKLAKERFTRFPYLCGLSLYYDDDLTAYLEKFELDTNNLACILRCFENLVFIRVFCAVGAIIGVHLVEPFVQLTR